jgi:organic hydroperoxide reductase OsmC/OhrA
VAEHRVTVQWSRGESAFIDNRYSRGHVWRFDGGVEVPASSSTHVVPIPMSVAAAVDPEEAFVAALSSCHMLWFLSIAASRGFVVEFYQDDATGTMEKNNLQKLAITRVTLRPDVVFSGDRKPNANELAEMHHKSHDECFIARSVRTEILCEPISRP